MKHLFILIVFLLFMTSTGFAAFNSPFGSGVGASTDLQVNSLGAGVAAPGTAGQIALNAGGSGWLLDPATAGELDFDYGGTTYATLDANNDQLLVECVKRDNTAAGYILLFDNDTDTGWYDSGNKTASYKIDNSTLLNIGSTAIIAYGNFLTSGYVTADRGGTGSEAYLQFSGSEGNDTMRIQADNTSGAYDALKFMLPNAGSGSSIMAFRMTSVAILPGADNTFKLGASGNEYKYIYAQNISDGDGQLDITGSLVIGSSLSVGTAAYAASFYGSAGADCIFIARANKGHDFQDSGSVSRCKLTTVYTSPTDIDVVWTFNGAADAATITYNDGFDRFMVSHYFQVAGNIYSSSGGIFTAGAVGIGIGTAPQADNILLFATDTSVTNPAAGRAGIYWNATADQIIAVNESGGTVVVADFSP